MSTIDAIAAARRRYLDSPKSRLDWVFYLETVERLRTEREGMVDPAPGSRSDRL